MFGRRRSVFSRALRPIVGALAVTLAIVGLQAAASATPERSETEGAHAPLERPDSVSAMVTARAMGERVEDLSRRSEMSQVFANPDGTWTSDTATEPTRVLDDSGVWHDVDPTLVERDGVLVPSYSVADVAFSVGGDKTFAAVTEGGKDLEWRWPSDLPDPTVAGPTATYPGAGPDGADLVVTATATGFTHNIVLHEPPAEPVEFTLPVVTDGAELTETPQGGLEIETRGGETLVEAPRPLMWDSSENVLGESGNVAPVETTVGETVSGTPTLTLSPDEDYLSDPDTVYPVTVDPSFTTYASSDTWVQSPDFTSSQGSSSELRAGTYDAGGHKARSFMHFEDGNATWAGKSVVSANLVLRNWHTETCSGGPIRAARITQSWSNSALTWANQPTITSTGAGDSTVAKGASTPSCPTGDVSWNVKDIVQVWANNTGTNYGIRLSAVSETNNNTWRRYRSANYDTVSSRPRLVVTYNSKPTTYTSVTPNTATALLDTTAGYSRTVTPTLSARVNDVDGGSVRAAFEVKQGATLVWSGSTGFVTTGAIASMPVPSGTLSEGQTYSVRVRAEDGTDVSAWSSTMDFMVDTIAPTLTVSASGFTHGTWATSSPGSNSFTLNGDISTTLLTYAKDGGNPATVTPDGSGDASFSWLPTSGYHEVVATAADAAGNATSSSVFWFGVGTSPYIVTPGAQARSTSVFPLHVEAPPNVDSATIKWRYAGASSWTVASGTSTKTWGGANWGNEITGGDNIESSEIKVLWDAREQTDPATSASIEAPALIELQACITGMTIPISTTCSTPRRVQLVPSGFGGDFPVTSVGPAAVALATGAFTLSQGDAADDAVGVGRTFTSFDAATAADGPFGAGWSSIFGDRISSASAGTIIDHRSRDGSLVLRDADEATTTFVPTAESTVFEPAEETDDTRRLVLDTAATPGTLTLTEDLGAETVWHLTGSAWLLHHVTGPVDTGSVSYERDSQNRLVWMAQGAPTGVTCTKTTQQPGCRGLIVAWDSNDHVTAVQQVAYDPKPGSDGLPTGAAAMTTTTVAEYTYDGDLLEQVCDPRPSTELCTSYTYTTVNGRDVLATLTPAGQTAWEFSYDSEGRLTTVTRALDPDTNVDTGDAIWTLVYDVDPTAAGLADFSSSNQWGQQDAPHAAAAVFGPNRVPASPPVAADWPYASLWYTDRTDRVTNTAVYGSGQWLVDTTWYDNNGNINRTLDGAGRARALEEPVPANRSVVAQQASKLTIYNDDGTRVVDEYEPVRTATLDNGTTGLYRPHTHYVYDDDPDGVGLDTTRPALPDDETSFGLVVEERHSAATPDRSTDHDTQAVRYEYSPNVTGDGNGWTLGTPTRTKVQTESGWSTAVARFDDAGRQIETRQPGGGAASDGSGNDAHATVTSYYAAGAVDSDCTTTGHSDRNPWAGLACKTGPAAQPTGPTMPITHHFAYGKDLQPTRVVETSGSTTRTTTATYDDLGRPLTTTVADGADTRTSTTGYDTSTGLPTSQAGGGETTQSEYDSWARPHTYTDASGLVSTTTYTRDSQVATLNDGVGTYTYAYDTATGEHRRLPNSVDLGLPGLAPDTFTLTYDSRGANSTVTYPNGMVATSDYNQAGVPVSLEYSYGGTGTLLTFAATVDVEGRVLSYDSTASSQDFTYDALGRLTKAQDYRPDSAGNLACTTRSYGFSAASERTSLTSYAPGTDGACQTTTATVGKSNTYDTANRIRNTSYTYDSLGRTLTVPAADTAPGATSTLRATYFANDMVKTLAQTVDNGAGGIVAKESNYLLDPHGRIDTITNKTNSSETNRLRYRFSDGSDSPSSIQTSTNAGADWTTTRYLTVAGLGMIGAVGVGGVTYQIANLHGDAVATQLQQSGSPTIDTFHETDEYGNSATGSPDRYGWLGVHQRSLDTSGGLVLMGARLFNPATGLFLSPDQVQGGNATAYTYPLDLSTSLT